MNNIDWSKQHCGVHQAPYHVLKLMMPDIVPVLKTFPDNPVMFTWDVKVHMLMPNQYPCIPNWHYDNVPRENGVQQFDKVKLHLPMYLWVSGPPLTQFQHGFVQPEAWHRFTQQDIHRGSMCDSFTWRCFIRASHVDILPPKPVLDNTEYLRRHSQVYLDAATFVW